MASVLVASVSGVQDWIIGGATELRVIRGGSRLLAKSFEDAAATLQARFGPPVAEALRPSAPTGWPAGSWWPMVQSSGALTALFRDDADALQAQQSVVERLQGRLPGLGVNVGVGAWPDVADQQLALRQAMRDAGERAVLIGAEGRAGRAGALPCQACGRNPASGAADHLQAKLCSACHLRGREGLGPAGLPAGLVAESQLGEIGLATHGARYRGYVAVICADGNGIGRRFTVPLSPVELAGLSRQVKEDVERAVDAAWGAALSSHRSCGASGELPVAPLMKAGDDVRIVTPAHVGLAAAAALATGSRTYQSCAGVLLCHSSLPFNVAHDAAEDLLSEAKRAARQENPVVPPARVAVAVESASSVRRDYASDVLSASPYSANEAIALLDASDALSASSSSLHAVAASLQNGGRAATRDWQRFRLSLGRGDREVLDGLWAAAGHPSSEDPWWRDSRSPLLDLITHRSLRAAS